MNRIKLLLCMAIVAAVTVLFAGISITFADQAAPAVTPAAAAAAKVHAAEAAKQARAKRDAAIQKRRDAKKYIQKVVEGQQPGSAAVAPANAGKEGAQ